MDDLISRQAAIDAIEYITSSMSVCVNTDECHGMKRMQRQAVIELANLPSAQPEIIRCKDCRYYQDNNDGYPHINCKWDANETPDADDFCSGAERRTDE